MPETLICRQPFPGPGLAIRIMGEVTKEKLTILREADFIFRSELEKTNFNGSQYFAVLTSVRTAGVMGDKRTYDYTLAKLQANLLQSKIQYIELEVRSLSVELYPKT